MKGRLAQLVQSICLTSRGSAVRIRQRPPFINKKHFGRLAQLVQSICLTSRGSAVRIRQRPQKESSFTLLFLFPPLIQFKRKADQRKKFRNQCYACHLHTLNKKNASSLTPLNTLLKASILALNDSQQNLTARNCSCYWCSSSDYQCI